MPAQGGTPLRRFVQPDAAFRLRHVSLDDILTYQLDGNNTNGASYLNLYQLFPKGKLCFMLYTSLKKEKWSIKTRKNKNRQPGTGGLYRAVCLKIPENASAAFRYAGRLQVTFQTQIISFSSCFFRTCIPLQGSSASRRSRGYPPPGRNGSAPAPDRRSCRRGQSTSGQKRRSAGLPCW